MVNSAADPNLPRMPQSELILPLSNLSHLFNAPPQIDPSSPSPAEVLGTSGVDYAFSLLHLNKPMQRDARTLVLLLPADSGVQAQQPKQIEANLRRLIDFRIQRERRELRNTYVYGWKVAGIAFIALALCLGMSSLFSSEMTANMRPLLRKTLEYGFEIVGWVMLWHPIDVLGYTPLAIRSRIRALQALGAMDVTIRTGDPADADLKAPAAAPQVFA
jgi:hypothetical protein